MSIQILPSPKKKVSIFHTFFLGEGERWIDRMASKRFKLFFCGPPQTSAKKRPSQCPA